MICYISGFPCDCLWLFVMKSLENLFESLQEEKVSVKNVQRAPEVLVPLDSAHAHNESYQYGIVHQQSPCYVIVYYDM